MNIIDYIESENKVESYKYLLDILLELSYKWSKEK